MDYTMFEKLITCDKLLTRVSKETSLQIFSRLYLSNGQAYGMVDVRRMSVRLSVTGVP